MRVHYKSIMLKSFFSTARRTFPAKKYLSIRNLSTIFALSTGYVKSAVAVFRVSGPKASKYMYVRDLCCAYRCYSVVLIAQYI